jgi:hypothetical protein
MTVGAALGDEHVRGRRAKGAAMAVALLLALSPRVALADEVPPGDDAAEPAAATPTSRDEIRLRDGRQIEGRIIERALGRWIVIETDDGYRRTFPWDTVQEVAVAAKPPPAGRSTLTSAEPMSTPTEDAPAALPEEWRGRGGGGATYGLHASVATLAMPDRTFHLTGTCSTGSGNQPVSIYGQSAKDGATGFGGGVGGRFGWMYRSEMHAETPASWWAFRAGSGLDVLVFSVHTPTGLPAVNGGLCAEVSKATYDLKYESSATFAVQVPLNLGGHFAVGKLDGPRWSGIVFGAAYTPTFIQATPFTSTSSSHFNPLGFELTVDFAVMHAGHQRRPPEPQLRASFFFAPHTLDSQPAIGTLSVGVVWF